MAVWALIGEIVASGANYFKGQVDKDKSQSAYIAAQAQSEAAAAQQKQLITYAVIAAAFLFLIYYLTRKTKK